MLFLIATCARRLGWIGVALSFGTTVCDAFESTVSGDARVAEEYNSNLFLTTNTTLAKPVFGHGFDANINLDVADQTWGATLTSAFANRWYTGQDNLDYNNQIFSGKSHYQITERQRLSLDANYSMVSTLTSEFDNNIGYLFTRIPSTQRGISPGWLYSLDERTFVNLGYSYRDTSYESNTTINNNAPRFPNSFSHTGIFGLTHQYSDRLKLTSNSSYTDYTLTSSAVSFSTALGTLPYPPYTPVPVGLPGVLTTPTRNSYIRTLIWMGGFEYELTELTKIGFSGGLQYNETGSAAYSMPFSLSASGPVLGSIPVRAQSAYSLSDIYEAEVSRHFEKADLRFTYNRTISPTIQGILITYDRYGASGSYRLSPQLTAGLAVNYSSQAASVQSSVSSQNQQAFNLNYLSVESSITWQWTEHLNLLGQYRFSMLEYPAGTNSSATNAQSHAAFLNIQYVFDKQHF